METIYLDTHVVVWLYQKELDKFSATALRLLEESELIISAMVVLELEFLYEIGRLKYNAKEIISELAQTIELRVCDEKFSTITYSSLNLKWTRDPFDRIIVSNAKINNAMLISKDKNILANYEKATW